MEKIKLKPCPFCGAEAVIFRVSTDSELDGTYIVGCDGPNGSLCPCYAFGCSPMYKERELAVRLWNTREIDDGRDA